MVAFGRVSRGIKCTCRLMLIKPLYHFVPSVTYSISGYVTPPLRASEPFRPGSLGQDHAAILLFEQKCVSLFVEILEIEGKKFFFSSSLNGATASHEVFLPRQ